MPMLSRNFFRLTAYLLVKIVVMVNFCGMGLVGLDGDQTGKGAGERTGTAALPPPPDKHLNDYPSHTRRAGL